MEVVDNHCSVLLSLGGSLDATTTHQSCSELPLWRVAPIPTRQIPIDHVSFLQRHVDEPRPLRIPFSDQSCNVDDLLPEESLRVRELINDVNPQEASTHSAPATSTRPQGPSDQRPGSGSGLKRPASTEIGPSPKRLHTHAHRGRSSKQRAAKSAHALGFWKAMRGSFTYTRSDLLLENFVGEFERERLNKHAPTDPAFVPRVFCHVIDQSNAHADFSAEGLRRMTERFTFKTFFERDGLSHIIPRTDDYPVVRLKSLHGKEAGDHADSATGVYRLANLYCSFPSHFRPGVNLDHVYAYAADLTSGLSDIASRSLVDSGHSSSRTVVMQLSRLLAEKKTTLTFRDLLEFVHFLALGEIQLQVDDRGVHQLNVPIAAIFKYLLSQIPQQLHVNRARYLLLDMCDVFVLFKLQNTHQCHVSKIFFRDPETYDHIFKDVDHLNHLVRHVKSEHGRTIVTRCRQGLLTEDPSTQPSLLSVLVAGLTLDAADEGLWLTEAQISQGVKAMKPVGAASGSAGKSKGGRGSAKSGSKGGTSGETRAPGGSRDDEGQDAEEDTTPDGIRFRVDEYEGPTDFEQLVLSTWAEGPAVAPRHAPGYPISPVPDMTHMLTSPPDSVLKTPSQSSQSHRQDSSPEVYRALKPTDRLDPLSPSPAKTAGMPTIPAPTTTALSSSVVDSSEDRSFSSSNGASVAPTGDLALSLVSFAGRGRLWEAYRARVDLDNHSFPPLPTQVVIKLCDLMSYPLFDRETLVFVNQYNRDMARKAVENEIELLCGPLRPLQGTVVPRLYGRWTGWYHDAPCGINRRRELLVMEDCGEPVLGDLASVSSSSSEHSKLEPDLAVLPVETKNQIIQAYHQLHQVGVLHGEVSARHILAHPGGGVRLVDYDCSRYFAPSADGSLDPESLAELKTEMDEVFEMLGTAKEGNVEECLFTQHCI